MTFGLLVARLWSLGILAAFLGLAAARADDPVLEWNAALLNAARTNNTPSAPIARNFAILHLAIADAILGHKPAGDPGDDVLLSSVWAASDVASALYPDHKAAFERLRDTESAQFQTDDRTQADRERGHQIAARVLEERRNDGVATSVSYIPKTAAGEWRRTPPAFRPPELPNWGAAVKPMVLERAAQFRPPGPPPLTSPEYAAAVNETRALGKSDSATRTPEQTQIARFWSDFSYTEMPVGHWNSIARKIAKEKHLTSSESARLFVLLNLALADTGVACWEAKYHYNAWRPVTEIPRADETKNPGLTPDQDWKPLLNTPPHPEYPSGHSAFSGAATSVLSHFFNTDAMNFDVQSDTLPDQHRRFDSFSACALECGNSRIYGGIHFPFSCADGLKLGAQIGDFVYARAQAKPPW